MLFMRRKAMAYKSQHGMHAVPECRVDHLMPARSPCPASAPAKLKRCARVHDHESAPRKDIVAFGHFRLRAAERLLEKDGVRLKLGSRALDILVALVERAPEVVTKRELL